MRHFIFCLSCFLIAACHGHRDDPKANSIDVRNAYITLPIGGNTVSLGGLEIEATGAEIRLIGASTAAARRVEIHTTTQDDQGRLQMRRLEELVIAPGTVLDMGQGKAHLMVFGLDEALVSGEAIDLTLSYMQDNADSSITVRANIKDFGDAHEGHGS